METVPAQLVDAGDGVTRSRFEIDPGYVAEYRAAFARGLVSLPMSIAR